jgi:hypothetical protein
MAEAENIASVRRMYDEVFNRKNLDLVDAIVAPTFKNHTVTGRTEACTSDCRRPAST